MLAIDVYVDMTHFPCIRPLMHERSLNPAPGLDLAETDTDDNVQDSNMLVFFLPCQTDSYLHTRPLLFMPLESFLLAA